jgi:hypothetical protein
MTEIRQKANTQIDDSGSSATSRRLASYYNENYCGISIAPGVVLCLQERNCKPGMQSAGSSIYNLARNYYCKELGFVDSAAKLPLAVPSSRLWYPIIGLSSKRHRQD